MTARTRSGLLALVILALAGIGSSVPAAAAAATPAWHIVQTTTPTILKPGSEASIGEVGNTSAASPAYAFIIKNVGGASTSGTITITDTLPTGVTTAPDAKPAYSFLGEPDPENGKRYLEFEYCDVSGQVVTCEIPHSYVPFSFISFYIPLAVGSMPGKVRNEVVIEGGGAPVATNAIETEIGDGPAPFSFIPDHGFAMTTYGDSGNAPLAGSHPFFTEFSIEATNNGLGVPAGGAIRNIGVGLPNGFVVNPQSTATRCTDEEINSAVRSPNRPCPPSSQIGQIAVDLPGLSPVTEPLYNMQAQPGTPSDFAFTLEQVAVHIIGGLNGEYHLTAHSDDLLGQFHVAKIHVTLWGNPSDPRFNRFRYGAGCLTEGCSIEPSPAPLVTMPTACGEPEVAEGLMDSWLGTSVGRKEPLSDRDYQAIDVSGCNALEFKPTIASKATTNVADSPSGLDFNLHQPQNQQLDGIATANLKDATVTLPEGLNLNPAVADGLAACSESQMGYAPKEGKIRFATTPQTCPDASKLGSVEIKTPLLDHKLPGAIYLAKPYENPFGNLTAIYLAIEDEESGIVAKLAGKATPDPVTGQLTATFAENPEQPVEDIDLHFFNGARAPFTTPLSCGTKTTTSTLTPWSSPEGADAHPSDSFQTQVPAGGSGNCPSSEANAPNKPSFTAGTVAPEAGAYSPFVLRLTRKDGTQRLTAIDTTLPKGLAAKFAGIPYCSEAQIAQAQARSNPNQGALEQSNPSCPAASEVGTVEVGAGSGPTPTYVSGRAYLAGPYKGAPLSLAIITPAVAGPFDLGAVVVRTALYINPETAQGRAVSDPLPSILQGIPLDIRSIAVKLGRPDFTLNPTSCDPMSITGAATALTGQSAALTSPFQVGGCSALKFKPNLKISLKGGTKRHRFPALKAVLTYPKGQNANIASAQVTLPHSAFLEQSHIGTVCTRVQFAADACPAKSIYGKAKAITPLLDQPLEGPVYLRSSSHELPDLVAALHGQIDVDLVGRIDTGKGGGIRNTFEAAPDAPVSRFVLEMQGGKKGLLVNSEDICRKPQRATVAFTGQNGKAFDATPLIANSCKGKAKKKGPHSKKGHGHKR